MPTEYEIAISRLHKKRQSDKNYICPCHDDREGSLSVHRGNNGKALINCFAGCSFESIIKALDLRPDRNNGTPIITATYDYTDAEGKLLYQVVRYHPKGFKQRRLSGLPSTGEGENDWIWDLNGITPTLYHLSEVWEAICQDEQLFIVEGEKDVDNLRKNNWTATTISGGASTKWHPSLVPLFEGARVVIIPDNDKAGHKYANYVANLLYGWCASLKLITLPAKDVSDYLVNYSAHELIKLVNSGEEYVPLGVVTRDEFNSFRGVNLYLWQQLRQRKPKHKPKYS